MGAKASAARFVLHHAGAELPLRGGESYVIGRSVECKIVLADHMVSRRHARLIVGATLLIEDLGSANGVYVDGRRIRSIWRLLTGQRIQIGAQELVVETTDAVERSRVETRAEGRARAATLPDTPASQVRASASTGVTDRVNFPEVLLELTRRLLLEHRGEEAERLLDDLLTDVLARSLAGELLDEELVEACARRALGLAGATRKARWLEYVFELYAAVDRLLPEALINESYRVVRFVRRPSSACITAYVQRLEARPRGFGPSERFLLKRLRGLEHMAQAR